MKVILLEDVKSLGKADDIVEVSSGYANNMLFKKKLALEATPANLNSVKMRKKTEAEKLQKEYDDAVLNAKAMEGRVFELPMKCGEGNRLYGAVTGMDIAKAIEASGFKVDKRNISIDSHIKTLGEYDAEIRLHSKVSVKIRLHVVDIGKHK
jgi:large subunit ribosomal protein L9